MVALRVECNVELLLSLDAGVRLRLDADVLLRLDADMLLRLSCLQGKAIFERILRGLFLGPAPIFATTPGSPAASPRSFCVVLAGWSLCRFGDDWLCMTTVESSDSLRFTCRFVWSRFDCLKYSSTCMYSRKG